LVQIFKTKVSKPLGNDSANSTTAATDAIAAAAVIVATTTTTTTTTAAAAAAAAGDVDVVVVVVVRVRVRSIRRIDYSVQELNALFSHNIDVTTNADIFHLKQI
jgi:hypothetical protein